MAVCGLLNTGVSFDCDNKSTGGLEQARIYLGNKSDIDYNTSVVNRDSATGSHNISNLALVTGAKLYSFAGITNKRLLNASYSFQEGDFLNTLQHSVDIGVYDQSEASLALLNQFLTGAEVFAIVEQKSKGVENTSAFQIYGFHTGLTVGDIPYNANENNGIIILPLTSPDPFEPYPPYKFEETDYATTITKIDGLL